MERRFKSAHALFFRQIFQGSGIDIGAGDDLIQVEGSVVGFDVGDGDANVLHKYVLEDSCDFIHASQCLEHMIDPKAALTSWLKVLKKGGHAIISVPSWELYEGMIWPSRFNPDHKSTWSMWQKDSPATFHVKLPEWLEAFNCRILLCELVDSNYDYKICASYDQTRTYKNKVEAFIEFVLQKL